LKEARENQIASTAYPDQSSCVVLAAMMINKQNILKLPSKIRVF